MNKTTKTKRRSDMQAEYDFSRGERGKYAARYAKGTNVVVLSPDVARHFSDSQAVNQALRALVKAEAAHRKDKK